MARLRIFCDAKLNESSGKLLQDGIAPNELILPRSPSASVLTPAASDPMMLQSDIIFGQPGVESVLKSKRLRWLHITSAGFTRYDTPEFRAGAKARGLLVTNSSTVYTEACAEHVFAFMLAQARELPGAIGTRCASGSSAWLQLRGAASCLRHQEAVILGYGAIASRLVELLAPFRIKITALRRHPRGDEGVSIVTPENLATALATADHVINILPENADSLHFISAERLKQMKRGTIFYNIGRGRTVDQEALADSLTNGQLGAAWLDVTDPEPLSDNHPLWSAPGCYITPHIAGGHVNESESLVRHFLDNFQRFLQGSSLHDRIM
jgi:phosphoglycerate dehydrogenase-like enzyme